MGKSLFFVQGGPGRSRHYQLFYIGTYNQARAVLFWDKWMDLQYTSQRAPPKMPGGSLLCEGKGGSL